MPDFLLRPCRSRPPVELVIRQTTPAAWRFFRGHHYLDTSLHRSARCYVAFWGEALVAFTSYLHMPHAKARNLKREHRTVVLPDFQGVGIGNALSEWLGALLRSQGWRFTSTTSQPAMLHHRGRSPKWKLLGLGRQSAFRAGPLQATLRRTSSRSRITSRWEYVGPALA